MKYKKFIFCAVCLFAVGITSLHAQEAIPASGGEAFGSGGTVSYSVGQMVYNTTESTSESITQGVQQPFEISIVTSIDEASGIKLVATAYPNPTTDYLLLTIDGEKTDSYTAKIFDINGKLVGSEKIFQHETKIDMQPFIQGAYFLKIVQEEIEMKKFKIIKN